MVFSEFESPERAQSQSDGHRPSKGKGIKMHLGYSQNKNPQMVF